MIMSSFSTIPLSLYVHIPWCIRKCPYCDFNSYPKDFAFDEDLYVDALLLDLQQDLHDLCSSERRNLHSIFIGGGTPSLFSLSAIAKILSKLNDNDIEITMEVNPGTIDYEYLVGIRSLGVNRLSLGVQSFQDDKLQALGRIHDAKTAIKTVKMAHDAGFENINLDLIFGLPKQNVKDAIFDLQNAASLAPTHISWYQLTIEEGSQFYQKPPTLPNIDEVWEIQRAGQEYLKQNNYAQYEVSAYSKPGYQCQHNLNYWFFGDYFGIGAGAHGKITSISNNAILEVNRTCKLASPVKYSQGVENKNFTEKREVIATEKLPFEFMLNALRLYQPIPFALFRQRTGLNISVITDQLCAAESQGLIEIVGDKIITTDKGRNFLNDLLEIFV